MLGDALRLLHAAGPASRLLVQVQRARDGDPEAIEYIKREGWAEALDLVRPGAGRAGLDLAEALRGVRPASSAGQVIEGEFREIEAPPWHRFLRWLVQREWGGYVILGPKGQGKTMLGLRLAEVWHEQLGWPVDGLNLYGEDRPDWLRPISLGTLDRRVRILQAALRSEMDPADLDVDELDEELVIPDPSASLERIKRRIVVLDESGMAMTNSGQDRGRRLARIVMAQARHLEWNVVYIGQLAGQMPLDLLTAEATFVKRPGDEARLDRQQPIVQDLWERAGEAFRDVRRTPWYSLYPDVRAWCYVHCPTMGGQSFGYRGLMPFTLPGADVAEPVEAGSCG
jgi:hypothetical protein